MKAIGAHRTNVQIGEKEVNIPNDVEVAIEMREYGMDVDFIAHSTEGNQFLRFTSEKEKQTLIFYALYRHLEANEFLPGQTR